MLKQHFDEITVKLEHMQALGLLCNRASLKNSKGWIGGKFEDLRIQTVNREAETAKAQLSKSA